MTNQVSTPGNRHQTAGATSLAAEEELSHEQELSQRWRHAILKLSDNLKATAAQRSDLTPILMEALNYALRELLEHGNDYYVNELEEWLEYEDIGFQAVPIYSGPERRGDTDRRGVLERRQGTRRTGSGRRHCDPQATEPHQAV